MKRIWFGVGLLVFLLLLGFGSSTLMERFHQQQATQLELAANHAMSGNWDAADAALTKARDSWEENSFLIAALTDHEPMEQIDGFFAELDVSVRLQDALSFSSGCKYLASQMTSLGRSHRLSFENLF